MLHLNPVVETGFEPVRLVLALENITTHRKLATNTRNSRKYAQIANSIVRVGIIEAPVVCRLEDGKFRLLDGLIRLHILGELGITETEFLIATDDEAYTYNRQVSHLTTIQEHRMILRAIEKGASSEQIADALAIDVTTVRQKQKLLEGICPEVVDLLKDRHVAINVFFALKRMKPLRQIEVVELMVATNRLTVPYARALLAATLEEDLSDVQANKGLRGITRTKVAMMEWESANLDRQFKLAEQSYGRANLELLLAKAYVRRVLESAPILQYLIDFHRDMAAELRRITAQPSSSSSR